VVYDLNGLTRTDWDKLPKNYLQTGDPRCACSASRRQIVVVKAEGELSQ
jgi:hypothetical protein